MVNVGDYYGVIFSDSLRQQTYNVDYMRICYLPGPRAFGIFRRLPDWPTSGREVSTPVVVDSPSGKTNILTYILRYVYY